MVSRKSGDVENKCTDTKGGKWRGGRGVMNWEIGMDMYTLICIKWINNKNLLHKKTNKTKFKNSTTTTKKKVRGEERVSLH